MRAFARFVVCVGVLCAMAPAGGAGAFGRGGPMRTPSSQMTPQNASSTPTIPGVTTPGDAELGMRERMREKSVDSANVARHKRLLDDAAKLLALSTELKADVEKSTKDELSVEVIRKAAEIEKLAHDVKERMKQ